VEGTIPGKPVWGNTFNWPDLTACAGALAEWRALKPLAQAAVMGYQDAAREIFPDTCPQRTGSNRLHSHYLLRTPGWNVLTSR
jgi:hypothetical protein